MTGLTRTFRRRLRRAPEQESALEAAPAASGDEAAPIDIAPNDPLLAYLQSASGAVDVEALELDSPALAELKAAGIKLAVPLVSQGELIGVLNLGPRLSEQEYSSDDRKLLDNLAAQAAPALRVGQLVRQQQAEAATRQRFEQELEVAKLIQQNFLPKQLPELSGWQVAAYYRPAREVGGDFYDVIPLPGGKVGFVVGDVTDKGVPAALVMAATRSVLRASAQRLVEPGETLERVNEHLCPDMPEKMFVTCLYGVLDPETGHFRFANAGHDLPYVKTAEGSEELRARGMPLGLMPGMPYEEKETVLQPGDSLLLHSDGVVEAHDPDGEMFGFPRLKQCVADYPGGGELIDRVLSDLHGHTGPDAEQEDDITMVVLQRSPGAAHLVNGAAPDALLVTEFEVPSAEGNERLAIERVSRRDRRPRPPREPARSPQDRGRRGDDERDGARLGLPRGPPGQRPRAHRRRPRARPDHRSRRRAAGGGARGARPRGQARRAAAPARLGPLPDREHGRRDARDERRGAPHPRARHAPGGRQRWRRVRSRPCAGGTGSP